MRLRGAFLGIFDGRTLEHTHIYLSVTSTSYSIGSAVTGLRTFYKLLQTRLSFWQLSFVFLLNNFRMYTIDPYSCSSLIRYEPSLICSAEPDTVSRSQSGFLIRYPVRYMRDLVTHIDIDVSI